MVEEKEVVANELSEIEVLNKKIEELTEKNKMLEEKVLYKDAELINYRKRKDDEVNKKLEFEIKPIIGNYIKQQEAIYNMFYNAFNEMTSKRDNYHFSGKTNILKAPEFNDANKIRSIIDKLEDKDVISSIEEDSSGINVYIGEESKIDSDVTVIKTKYVVNGNEGTIAIIGPKRMNYDKVISILDFIKSEIEKK